MYHQNIGRNVSVKLRNGNRVEGWLYAQTPQDIHVALDDEANHIRLILSLTQESISFGEDASGEVASARRSEAAAIDSLEEALKGAFDRELDRLDQNRIRYIGKKLYQSHMQLSEFDHLGYAPQAELLYLIDGVEAHRELLDELTKSGIDNQLMKHREILRKNISLSTIPQMDDYVLTLNRYDLLRLIELAREQDLLSEANLGRDHLEKISGASLLELDDDSRDVDRESDEESSRASKRAKRLKKIAAGLKITAGGGLAVANVALGGLTGVVSALPTLGIGSVSAVVGMASSIYTGLNAASGGLNDLATVIEASEGKDS